MWTLCKKTTFSRLKINLTRCSSILTLIVFKFEKKIVFSASKVDFLQEFQAKTPFLKAAWGASGANLGHVGAILGHLGVVLGPSCGCLGAILGHLGAILGDLKRS